MTLNPKIVRRSAKRTGRIGAALVYESIGRRAKWSQHGSWPHRVGVWHAERVHPVEDAACGEYFGALGCCVSGVETTSEGRRVAVEGRRSLHQRVAGIRRPSATTGRASSVEDNRGRPTGVHGNWRRSILSIPLGGHCVDHGADPHNVGLTARASCFEKGK